MSSSNALTAVSTVAHDARSWLDRIWSSVADRGRKFANVPGRSLPPLDRTQRLAETLISERGEASGAAVAREILDSLHALSAENRAAFFAFLAERFGPDPDALRLAAERYLADPSPEHATTLSEASEPRRQELLRRMNMAPGGTAALVHMRQDVLGLLRTRPELRPLDADFRHLFASWFNRGFLELRRIDWQTPAAVLEKLIRYEAVHEIQGWDDLRRRLAPDRRCFGFFHPALPGEPLIFVEVALTEGLASAVQPLLEPEGREDAARAKAAKADTAIFYSISNCQDGLRGVSFGNFLIKQVVEELKADLPALTRFSTLSPVPGFRRWVQRRAEGEEADAALVELLAQAKEEPWSEDTAQALRQPLLRLCAEYLTRPNAPGGGIDPVARFHLGNGARLERVNWLGNTSARGMKESFGMMVNYLYDRDTIEANHETFVHGGKVVRSAAVDKLLSAPIALPPVDADATARNRGKRLARSPDAVE